MANLKDTPLQIPDQWAASWFRNFVVETLAKADIRNAIGVGVSITTNGNSVATLTVDPSGSILTHNLDPFAHVEAITAHKAESNPHTQYVAKQAATVADPSGGATVDTECRAKLIELLAVLRAAGAIGP